MAGDGFDDFLHRFVADRQHGASELARQALAWLGDSLQGVTALDEARRRELERQLAGLCAARPSMSAVAHLLQRWQQLLEAVDRSPQAPDLLAAEAQRLISLSRQAVAGCVHHARQLISPGQTLLTHSCSSTLMQLFSAVCDMPCHIIVCESRPLCEGVDVVRQLADWGMAVTLITDAQMGLYTAKADLVMVGADSLLGDGQVINKVGTRLLALAAQRDHCPFYVVAESFKQRPPSAGALVLEQMAVTELGHDLPPERMGNTYFDVTEADLISSWVDERGVHRRFRPIPF